MLIDFFSLHTRRAIARREEMRVKRSQVFGMAREIFLKIGAALAAEGLLDRQDDIFYLEMEEVFGTLRGTATLRDVRVVVAQRRSELAAAADREIPAHFTTLVSRSAPRQGWATDRLPLRDRGHAAPEVPRAEVACENAGRARSRPAS